MVGRGPFPRVLVLNPSEDLKKIMPNRKVAWLSDDLIRPVRKGKADDRLGCRSDWRESVLQGEFIDLTINGAGAFDEGQSVWRPYSL